MNRKIEKLITKSKTSDFIRDRCLCAQKKGANGIIWKLVDDSWKNHETLFDTNCLQGWNKLTQIKNFWNANQNPYFNIYAKTPCSKPTCMELKGILTDRVIAYNSSCLDKFPETLEYVLTKLELSEMSLIDISILRYHPYLQYIDLSRNHLENITDLEFVTYLIYLDVSHNRLKTLLNFAAPLMLTYVNYSNNLLKYIPDISSFWSIMYLNLSHNSIEEIENLQDLKNLKFLDLSYNKIEILKNISLNSLIYLNLEHNLISTYEFTDEKYCENFLKLNLSNNRLESVNFLKLFNDMSELNLANNFIDNIMTLEMLKYMNSLENIDFRGNPLVDWPNYRSYLIACVKNLNKLNGVEISQIERIQSQSCYKIQRNCFRLKQSLIFLKSKIGTKLDENTLPIDQPPYPIIALIGPFFGHNNIFEFYKKNAIFNKYFYFLKCHCTISKNFNLYNSIVVTTNEFDFMFNTGVFKAIGTRFGARVGISKQEFKNCIESGKIGVMCVPFNLVYNLRLAGEKPIVICALPEDTLFYERLLSVQFFIPNLLSNDGAFSVSERFLNVQEHTFTGREIIDEIIDTKVIPDYDDDYFDVIIQKTLNVCSDDALDEVSLLSNEYESIYQTNFNKHLQSLDSSSNPSQILNSLSNTNSGHTQIVENVKWRNQSTISKSNSSSKKSDSRSVNICDSEPAKVNYGEKKSSSKITSFPSYSYNSIFESLETSSHSDKITSTHFSSMISKRKENAFLRSIRGSVDCEMAKLERKKQLVQMVSRVFHSHFSSILETYMQANLLKPGVYNKLIYFQSHNFAEVFLQEVKKIIKIKKPPPFEQYKTTPEYINQQEINRNFVIKLLDGNSTISKKQEFVNYHNLKKKFCKL